ncbi:MAG: RNA polymerase sigma factor [Planctomycetes bacterium]|nr:RNA polymerase sigma factor [Planctomycetota bacterium]
MALAGEPLMARMALGDTSACEELMRTYGGAAYRFAYRIFRDRQISEDVSQELFFKLYRNAGRYEPQGKFTTYFYKVLNNLCLDTLRRMNRKSLPDFQSFENPVLDGMPHGNVAGQPEPAARLAEERRLVREAIGKLPESQRKVIVLRELEELKYREIAEVLDLSLNEVKVLIHRGRKALLRILQRSPLFEGSES